MRLRFRRRKQHGLVLLVVLSLLVLFMLILTTFLITSNQFRKAAVAQAQHEVAGDPPQVQLDRAMMQLLRDTQFNSRSSLARHSLLGDMYGSNGGVSVAEAIRSPLSAVAAVGNGQFLQLRLTTTTGLSNRPNYYAGRVLTFISGPAKGTSTRIVAYRPAGGTPATFTVVAPTALEASSAAAPAAGNEVLINGAPFNGSGAGLNPSGTGAPTLDATVDFPKGAASNLLEIALLPHYATYVTGGVNPNLGGEDESYDAADYQNMFLAMIRHRPNGTGTGFEDTVPVVTAPSFHRPSLINYWIQNTRTSSFWTNLPGDDDDKRFRRAVIMRPMPWDHPQFTGSNPAMTLENPSLLDAIRTGPWDVDNDGDGVNDSIWIDVGFPVQTNAKGQMYKPLVAILVKEMDSRLNVNAHSTIAQATTGVFDAAQTSRNTSLQPSSGDSMAGITSGGSFTLPRGNGYSPAEIYLRGLFANLNEYQNVVAGRYDTTGASPPSTTPIPQPGRAGTDDPLSRLITTQFPPNYQQAPTPVLSGYGSPPFNYGVRSMALDWAGNPYYPQPTPTSQTVDDPHEIDLMTRRARDAGLLRGPVDDRDRPYTHAELERLLRFRDADAPSLPDRLLRLAPNTFNRSSSRARDITTTDSRYVPVPFATYGREDYTGAGASTLVAGRPVTVIDVLAFRLQKGGVPAANINAEIERMLPLELFRGQRFDINRLFGNGRDDNGNGVVDEPREVLDAVETQAWAAFSGQFAGFNAAGFSHVNNDPLVTANMTPRVNPRQIFARQLYCLMMLMIDQGFQFPVTETGLAPAAMAELRSQRVAQWAVNVVDARDPDAIMTPFEYDVNPFNGWATYVNGDLQDNLTATAASQPERRLVWGAEAPDVLLTESLAFHDRRVRDTEWETDMEKRTTNPMAMNRDDDLDQLRKPEGSLFLELQCVRNKYSNNHGVLPRELYVNGVLNMSALAPATFAGWSSPDNRPYPVWQVSISEMYHNDAARKNRFSALIRSTANPDTCSFDPLDMSLLPGAPDQVPIERKVWFTRQSPDGYTYQNLQNTCFYNQAATNLGLAPGQFLVVGPRARTSIGSIQNTPASDDLLSLAPSNQRIELGSGVAVYDASNNPLTPGATSIQPVVSMIAQTRLLTPNGWTNMARAELNISEPLPMSADYYREPLYPTPGRDPSINDSYRDFTGMAGVVPDVPLDADPNAPINQMQQTGTYEDVRTVFLQRLADPTLPFHEVLNPYISVDWATIDLTVFNGDDRLTGDFDPQGGMPNTAPDEKLSTRQRGLDSRPLWSPITQLPNNTPNTGESVYFQELLRETLGYVNDPNPRDATIDHFVQGEVPNNYIGAPKRQTPWISWYDRPYESPFELLQVPAASASRLGFEYTNASDVDTGSRNPYNTNPGLATDPANNPAFLPFSHLTNFLQTAPVPTSGAPLPAPHFYRLFDYVETPSPFVGTRQYFNPSTGATIDTYRPPYNYISRFRDPGRVNINMVYDKAIFDGLVAGAAGNQAQKDALWQQVQESRRGFPGGSVNPYVVDNAIPTLFANPFRAAGAARLTPLPGQQWMEHREVDVTLLRPSLTTPNVPLFHVASTARHNNTTNNSHFRYQGLSRLGNLLSTTSNVFGVWMTIGYFEVEPNPTGFTVAHPDGFRLGIELGSDTGEVERHRAFYLIDRSIPVGYEPGFNHNVQKAILVRRFIE